MDFNCAAIPDTLLESKLFGYKHGAFTGARAAKSGAFQAANHGTLFLDHVTELSEKHQAKLLQVIEERAVPRLGSGRDEPLDVWILTATYEDLRARVSGYRRYREAFNLHENFVIENLYQHLGQLDLLIPPLRQRPDDILLLAEHFLARLCDEHNLRPKVIAPDARVALLAYDWPGNVREAKFLLARVGLRVVKKNIITAAMLALPNLNVSFPRP